MCVLCTDKAPLSKGLLLVLSGLTVMLALLPQYQELFVYDLQAVTQHHRVRLWGAAACKGDKETPLGSTWALTQSNTRSNCFRSSFKSRIVVVVVVVV